MSKTLYFVAGERSGDNHGAGLMRALRTLEPALRFLGRGGPQMKAIANGSFHDWVDEAGIVGLWEVIKNYGFFRRKFRLTLEEIAANKPDAVVLIDYPGFNLRLARVLRRAGTARKIIYYISPQVWAWNRGRIGPMARSLDLMLCIFPFEADLYNRSGLRTRFVGHPMIERLGAQKIDAARDAHLVGLFPGSRRREVRKIFPVLLKVVEILQHTQPSLRFEVAAASADLALEMESMAKRDKQLAHFKITSGNSSEIMQRAAAGIIASGSATLEAAYFRLPFVLVYKVSWLTYLAARLVVKVKHLGMPNVLAGREIVPEFIQHSAKPRALAAAVLELLNRPAKRDEMISNFDTIVRTLGEGGANMEAARAIMSEISVQESPNG